MDASPRQSIKQQGVFIITCTNRQGYAGNLFKNYSRQQHPRKELIIILNNDKIPLAPYQRLAKKHKNIQVFRVPGHQSLGACLTLPSGKQNTATLPSSMTTIITPPII